MSPRAITVVLNYDHKKKFTFLPSLQPPAKDAILREARSKFRSRVLSTVFLRGGVPLEERGELSELFTQVWVGKGEPYSGPPADRTRSSEPGELRIIGWV